MANHARVDDADLRDRAGVSAALALDASVAARAIRAAMTKEGGSTGPRGLFATRAMLGRLSQVRIFRMAVDFDRLFEDDYVPRSELTSVGVFARAAAPVEFDRRDTTPTEALDTLMPLIDSVVVDDNSSQIVILDRSRAVELEHFLRALARVAVVEAEASDVERTSSFAVSCR